MIFSGSDDHTIRMWSYLHLKKAHGRKPTLLRKREHVKRRRTEAQNDGLLIPQEEARSFKDAYETCLELASKQVAEETSSSHQGRSSKASVFLEPDPMLLIETTSIDLLIVLLFFFLGVPFWLVGDTKVCIGEDMKNKSKWEEHEKLCMWEGNIGAALQHAIQTKALSPALVAASAMGMYHPSLSTLLVLT